MEKEKGLQLPIWYRRTSTPTSPKGRWVSNRILTSRRRATRPSRRIRRRVAVSLVVWRNIGLTSAQTSLRI
jgi:hypothetical protein